MTLILYNHKTQVIGVDSRTTNEHGVILSDHDTKWFYDTSNVLWFVCGTIADIPLLVQAFQNGDHALDIKVIPDASAIIVRDGEAYLRGVTNSGEAWTQKLNYSNAIGSGTDFALAALDFGLTTEAAIYYVESKNCFVGGPVHIFDLTTNSFIKPAKEL